MKKKDLSALSQEELTQVSESLSEFVESTLDAAKNKIDKKIAKYGLKIKLSCTIELEDKQ